MKKFLLLIYLFPTLVFSQSNLDSLWSIWNDQTQKDTTRLNALKSIAITHLYSDLDSANYYSKQLYNEAKDMNNKLFMGHGINIEAATHYYQGKSDSALSLWIKAGEIFDNIADHSRVADTYNNIGNIYHDKGLEQKALEYYHNAHNIYDKLNDIKGKAACLANIGGVYNMLDDKDVALKNFEESLALKQQMQDQRGVATLLNNIGGIYVNKNNYEKALKYQMQSLKIKEELKDLRGMASTFRNIGSIYSGQGKKKEALVAFEKGLKVAEKMGFYEMVSSNLEGIGGIYYDLKNYNKAKIYLERALSVAQDVEVLQQIRNASELLWLTNKELKNDSEALKMYELFISSRDSIQSKENQIASIQLEYEFEYEKKAAQDSVAHAKEQQIKQVEIDKQKAELKVKQNQQYALFGGIVLVLVFSAFMFNRYKVTKKQKKVIEEKKEEVEYQRDLIEQQKTIVEEAHKEIKDSIVYAKRIQNAILPSAALTGQALPNSFILYRPKDVVAGDFYWLEKVGSTTLFAAADCTGHGVPGAMVSVVCNNALNRSVREYKLKEPGEILDKTREIVLDELSKSEEDVRDGMDIALCSLTDDSLKYAGANNPLWIIRNGQLLETKADRQPIGQFDNPTPYITHQLEFQKGDTLYLFSDGYADQFGGARDKKFGTKRFKELLLSIQDQTMKKQQAILQETFENWMKEADAEQLDDVCVIGVKIK